MVLVLGLKDKKKRKRSAISSISIMPCNVDEVPISSLITKKPKKKSGRKQTSRSGRKTRTKTRRPKYLSLRLQFSSTQQSTEMPSSTNTSAAAAASCSDRNSGSKQLDLFPLHPDNLVEEKEAHDENMAYLFSAADGGASTLTGLLESSTNNASSSSDHHRKGDNKNNESSYTTTTTLSPSASLTYAYGGRPEEEGRDLLRTALRNKEREPSEERWVRYSEVVERRDDQEVSSCAVSQPDMVRWSRNQNQPLSLKLDYEEILTAWSDKGSLFTHAAPPQSPQIVPDIHDDFGLVSQFPHGMINHGLGNDPCCVWRVPEFTVQSPGNIERGLNLVKVKTEEQQEQCLVPAEVVVGEDQWKLGQREASVKRYKEKRQNRLFSKRIRYQVRKINAEKRPRLKGRFVKRC